MADLKKHIPIGELVHQAKFRSDLQTLDPYLFPEKNTELPPNERTKAAKAQTTKKSIESEITNSLGIGSEKMTVGLLLNNEARGAVHDNPTRIMGYIRNSAGDPVAALQITLGNKTQVFVDGFDLTGNNEAIKAYVKATKLKDYTYSGLVDFNSSAQTSFFGKKGRDYILVQSTHVVGDSGASITTLGAKVSCVDGKCAVSANKKAITFDSDEKATGPTVCMTFNDVKVNLSATPKDENQRVLSVTVGGAAVVGFKNNEQMRIRRDIGLR